MNTSHSISTKHFVWDSESRTLSANLSDLSSPTSTARWGFPKNVNRVVEVFELASHITGKVKQVALTRKDVDSKGVVVDWTYTPTGLDPSDFKVIVVNDL